MNATRSPEEIEQDIEQKRADLAGTVDALQDRISPEGVIREIARGFRDHGGEFGTAVTRSVKQNPLALMLTGAGLAWLMFGRSHDAGEPAGDTGANGRSGWHGGSGGPMAGHPGGVAHVYAATGRHGGQPAAAGPYAGHPSWARHDLDQDWYDPEEHENSGAAGDATALGDRAADAAAAMAGGARGAANAAADRAERARRRLAEGTEALGEEARQRVLDARARAVHMANRAERAAREGYARLRDPARDFFDDQPLVAGALAMAAGAALAGALPRTRAEDDWLGATRDRLFDEAERILAEERDKAGRVAQTAVKEAGAAARSEAERQKLGHPGAGAHGPAGG